MPSKHRVQVGLKAKGTGERGKQSQRSRVAHTVSAGAGTKMTPKIEPARSVKAAAWAAHTTCESTVTSAAAVFTRIRQAEVCQQVLSHHGHKLGKGTSNAVASVALRRPLEHHHRTANPTSNGEQGPSTLVLGEHTLEERPCRNGNGVAAHRLGPSLGWARPRNGPRPGWAWPHTGWITANGCASTINAASVAALHQNDSFGAVSNFTTTKPSSTRLERVNTAPTNPNTR